MWCKYFREKVKLINIENSEGDDDSKIDFIVNLGFIQTKL